MSARPSKRERLILQAQTLGLQFAPSASEEELQKPIDRSPATERQRHFLNAFLRPRGGSVPADITFGEASKRIDAIEESLNTQAIADLELVEGQVRTWESGYCIILRVYGSQRLHKIRVQRVVLARDKEAAKATVRPIGQATVINPRKLDPGTLVDLTTWQPPAGDVPYDFDELPL